MVINFAHRGSLTEAPENTIAAMEKALEHQAKAIELDVQLTKDGHLIVIHDNKFTRLNKKVRGQVKDYTLAEIKKIDVGARFSRSFKGEKLATLTEMLQVIPETVLLNVEIKNLPITYKGIEEKVVETLEENNRLDNVIVSSFDHEALQKVRQINNDISLGMLLSNRLLNPWDYAMDTGLDLFSVHPVYTTVSKEFVEQFHAKGMKVFPYTVDHEKDYDTLIAMGVDGVFSNNPKIFQTK